MNMFVPFLDEPRRYRESISMFWNTDDIEIKETGNLWAKRMAKYIKRNAEIRKIPELRGETVRVNKFGWE